MKNKKAFTLIETIMAITLTTVVLTAVTGLILATLRANQRNLRTVQATFLAQEGLEAIRYMRDSNWLQNYAWDLGSDLWLQDFHVEELSPTLTLYLVPKLCMLTDPPTGPCFELSRTVEDGVVTLDNDFEFNRQLDFQLLRDEAGNIQEGAMEVLCTVTWEENSEDRSVKISTTLTDWQ